MSLNPWEKSRKELIQTALGRSHADLVFQQGIWLNVQSGEFVENTDIAVKKGKFANVGPQADHTIGSNTEFISAKNKYLVPGLLES